MNRLSRQHGFTLVELLISVAIAMLIMAGLAGVINQALQGGDAMQSNNEQTEQARFALQRMLTAVSSSRQLILPLADNPKTDWREHVREETVPPSTPEGSSVKATAVLAVTLDPELDRDGDGFADADNDQDTKVDEDQGDDMNNDGLPGIAGIDDDGDGKVDESDVTDFPERDDDEEGGRGEDVPNGIDDDGDGSEGEDGKADMNKDGSAGVVDVDEDGDGTADEDHFHDDDEDGVIDEDWLDPVVFYLSGSKLIERQPSLVDTNGDSVVTGADYSENIIAENVTRFRVERIVMPRAVILDISLEVTDARGESFALQGRARLGGRR